MKKLIQYVILLLGIPAVILLGDRVFHDKQYAFISLVIAIAACVPFFMNFERHSQNTHRLVLLSVMIALSVAGRFIFAVVPGFKPVTAIVVITAMYFGGEAGFLTGAMSAFLSNFYFGQGPWTPFQMFSWGLIGLIAGLISGKLKKSKVILVLYGIFAGILFSLLMDVWTVLWYENEFNLKFYLTAVISALPYTAVYAASNVIFLLCLSKPIGQKLSRIKLKYGLK